ncbi:MAG: STAS-like domain-containing protein [Candidatus Omnitrophica bacterium]|nr:STAS-like domain-containing protein [Candidatus Omnitrophota bacterium]
MKEINIYELIGNADFAENKDIGQEIRVKYVMPQLKIGEEVTLNFDKINKASQSFIHSIISEPIRKYGIDTTLQLIVFKSCNNAVKQIIGIVLEYMQDAINRNLQQD